jgi:hypothetical protein
MFRSVYRQGNGCDHESNRRPCRGFGERRGRAARSEGRLAALSTERRGNVATLAALQQNNENNEYTNQNVNRRDQIENHEFSFSLFKIPPQSRESKFFENPWSNRSRGQTVKTQRLYDIDNADVIECMPALEAQSPESVPVLRRWSDYAPNGET